MFPLVIIKSNNAENDVKLISDHYFINDCYMIITCIDELNEDNIETIISDYSCIKYGTKLVLQYPLLIFTDNDNVINEFSNIFLTVNLDKFNIQWHTLIDYGFLPIDSNDIIKYIHENNYITSDSQITSNNHVKTSCETIIFKLFKTLGYVNEYVNSCHKITSESMNANDIDVYIPTEKLICTINDIQPQIATVYQIIISDPVTFINLPNAISIIHDSLIESLKLIDINIHHTVYSIVDSTINS